MARYFLTTPLYYVNASPHLGHAYTNIAADTLARFRRLCGDEVLLLTGTDEHGQKIAQAARAAGVEPLQFADRMHQQFKDLWQALGVVYDDFIRTTEPRHVQAVQAVLSRLHEAGVLKHMTYQGWYCTPCETFWTASDFEQPPAHTAPLCLTCQRATEPVTEDGYYLPLRGAPQAWLLAYLREHPAAVQPSSRYNEVMGLLERPLPEYLCVTRPKQRVGWGIPVPFSADHVTYVWFDALINYISACGYPADGGRFRQWWPAQVHLIGKDILRHHAVYWPIMLHALGIEPPQMIFAHGWWKIGEFKMSKSRGNVVDPRELAAQYGQDGLRYFVLREVPFGQDGTFTEEALAQRLNAELADDIGNLFNRTLSMIGRYHGGRVPQPAAIGCAVEDTALQQQCAALPRVLEQAMASLNFAQALEAIVALANRGNQYIDAQAPWTLAKQQQTQRLGTVLYTVAELLAHLAIALGPFIPSGAQNMWGQLGFTDQISRRRREDLSHWGLVQPGQAISKGSVLFQKIETQ